MPDLLRKVIIDQNMILSPGNHYLVFHREFQFMPGQVIGITIDPRIEPRLYSIASGSDESNAAILYSIKEEGELTPKLAQLGAGDKIWITEAHGNFKHVDLPSWWIASGTGIAPYLSWLRSGLKGPDLLVFGARDKMSLHFDDELSQKLGSYYQRCCSRVSDSECFRGRVSDFLRDCDHLPQNNVYFICGIAEMVIDVREILLNRGVDPRMIHAEIYF